MVLLNSNPEDVVVALDLCRRAYCKQSTTDVKFLLANHGPR